MGPLPIGTAFALRVRPGYGMAGPKEAYLVAMSVSTSGKVAFVFPNFHRPVNDVTEERDYIIPYSDGLEIQRPAGTERFAMFLLDRNPFQGFDFGSLDRGLSIGKAEEVAGYMEQEGRRVEVEELRRALRGNFRIVAPANEADRRPYRRWARAVVTVQTVER